MHLQINSELPEMIHYRIKQLFSNKIICREESEFTPNKLQNKCKFHALFLSQYHHVA